ncbi:hypothetical protein EN925_05630 [Mesorhizobium sp. M7A.F.Ca.US.006.04.2.1]|uniref:hypothetical protein n=1 Tax=unclassified Mesorhizobium TaxID=325217 RepID=UPI000FCCD4C7|nr:MULTISPECIES: hypothetical protein [unclassified Mesorhizobium]RUX69949.1 hypothetical protein EN990_33160 [Mesorhizobium sp. M7A.F.Ca.US.005.03.1.1]RUY16696.1 hypothetical protein EN991_10455 [Mesorhizobium sp. M7A.F.Ca.US.005.03.2.1]RUY28958.1 hypothetical protein EN979_11720 [Mesorhizobium sp. M7A.F.Ca.US.001.04.2.1]RUY41470.1 hypothetical protein EN978_15225 [Mesorhizobium sp. M7A.F.Ca.US.001.04.1.1]RVA94649.1 hypothetical protein EN925_05630 [Mesorhizobium sp. M7A.F.Ca.US.006.04.2.1]
MAGGKGKTIESVTAEVNRLGSLLSKQAQQIISMSSRLHDLELMLSGNLDLTLTSEAVRLAGKGSKGKGERGKGKGKGGKGKGKGGNPTRPQDRRDPGTGDELVS